MKECSIEDVLIDCPCRGISPNSDGSECAVCKGAGKVSKPAIRVEGLSPVDVLNIGATAIQEGLNRYGAEREGRGKITCTFSSLALPNSAPMQPQWEIDEETVTPIQHIGLGLDILLAALTINAQMAAQQ